MCLCLFIITVDSESIQVIDTVNGPIITLREQHHHDDGELKPNVKRQTGECSNPSDTYGHDDDDDEQYTRHDDECDVHYDNEVFDTKSVYTYVFHDVIMTIRGTLQRKDREKIQKNLVTLVGAAGDGVWY